MTLFMFMVGLFAVIGVLATILIIAFIACVLQIRRCSEIGAIDLEDVE